MNFRAIMYF